MRAMHRKRPSLESPKLHMTPMIDVVFTLLTFFIMTFQVINPEGDFNVLMSQKEQQAENAMVDSDWVQVRLLAKADGSLSAILVDGEGIENFDLLRQHVSAISWAKPELEVELFPDENLRYEYVVRAITAVNGEMRQGQIRTICDKIKFVRQKGT